jgi:hypothetical protein
MITDNYHKHKKKIVATSAVVMALVLSISGINLINTVTQEQVVPEPPVKKCSVCSISESTGFILCRDVSCEITAKRPG